MKKMEKEFNVLIIDDETDIREHLSNMLKRRGYAVMTAADGKEGLMLAIEKRIDIIICDIYMPNMNGVEFLRKIRSMNIKAEVIIVSGNPTIEICVESYDKNAVDYLTKPVTVEDVLHSLVKAEKRIRDKEALFKTAALPPLHHSHHKQ